MSEEELGSQLGRGRGGGADWQAGPHRSDPVRRIRRGGQKVAASRPHHRGPQRQRHRRGLWGRAFQKAQEEAYTLSTTKEVIHDPDLVATWRIDNRPL